VRLLVCNLASLAAVVGAVYLASLGKDGWGWCLFVSVLLHSTWSSK
jgi:hypothetical protein